MHVKLSLLFSPKLFGSVPVPIPQIRTSVGEEGELASWDAWRYPRHPDLQSSTEPGPAGTTHH